MDDIELEAQAEAVKRYPDEIAKTLGGVRHGFVEGALWAAKQKSSPHRVSRGRGDMYSSTGIKFGN